MICQVHVMVQSLEGTWDIQGIEKTESEEGKEIGHEVRLEMSYCAASL